MDLSTEILSDITVHMKYAKYDAEKMRRESWSEICQRNRDMHLNHVDNLDITEENKEKLKKKVENVYTNFVYPKKVLPSMRSMQFAGKPLEISPNRVYNCAYMPVDSVECFHEAMFLLMNGTGLGYSVQRHHVRSLPEIRQPNSDRTRKILEKLQNYLLIKIYSLCLS